MRKISTTTMIGKIITTITQASLTQSRCTPDWVYYSYIALLTYPVSQALPKTITVAFDVLNTYY